MTRRRWTPPRHRRGGTVAADRGKQRPPRAQQWWRPRGGRGRCAAGRRRPARGRDRRVSSARDENQRMQAHIAELERALSQGKNGAQQQVVQLQQQLAQTEQQLAESRQQLEQAQRAVAEAQQAAQAAPQPQEQAPGAANMEHHAQAVQVLALAQQTADQHLAQSKAEAERLLAEAQNHSETTVTSAGSRPSGPWPRPRAGRSSSTKERRSGRAHHPGRRAAGRDDHRPVRAAQGGARAAGRGVADVRARVPHPAQELPRVAAARPGRERQHRAGPERRHGRRAGLITLRSTSLQRSAGVTRDGGARPAPFGAGLPHSGAD